MAVIGRPRLRDLFDDVLEILTAEEPDVNRIPVTSDGFVEGIITRQDVLVELYSERKSKA